MKNSAKFPPLVFKIRKKDWQHFIKKVAIMIIQKRKENKKFYTLKINNS
jgi:hypothetical protein